MKRVIAYKDKKCLKCNSVYTPRSSTQQWCDKCLTKKCMYCGEEFHVGKKSKYDTSKFCSRRCMGLYNSEHYIRENAFAYKNGNRTLEETICAHCGKTILREKQFIDKHKNNFCDVHCKAEYQKEHIKGKNHPRYSKVLVVCEWCGKEYRTYKCTKNQTRFCSKRCRHDWQSDMMSGDNHYNWQGGISEQRSRDWVSREYRKWRQQVFKRDNYTCQVCGDSTGGNLNAHHIKPYRDYPELRREITNGITLCEACHVEVHRGTIKLDIQSELQI